MATPRCICHLTTASVITRPLIFLERLIFNFLGIYLRTVRLIQITFVSLPWICLTLHITSAGHKKEQGTTSLEQTTFIIMMVFFRQAHFVPTLCRHTQTLMIMPLYDRLLSILAKK